MIDLDRCLADLGDALDLDEHDELVDRVLARLADAPGDDDEHRFNGGSWPAPVTRWRAAAVVLVAATTALLAIPGSRHAIADWFGLAGVDVERRPDLSVPADVPPLDRQPMSGEGESVTVGGTPIIVDEIDIGEHAGRLDEVLISKSLAADTGIERVDVAGQPGLWIDGEPHVVSYWSADGSSVTERFAANTLLWQDGDVIRRVEGFADLAAAPEFATTLD